jgi:glutamyl-Q tRNA(Asp) synthetase
MAKETTRFAPSPTGHLHLGHAYAALFAAQAADGGRFLLRIEDIDRTRCRPEYETAIAEDLAWLGLTWETPVRRQSEHMAEYRAAVDRLAAMNLVYPCFCTRAEIAAEIARSASAPQGPDGPRYPGTCRALTHDERAHRIAHGVNYALRLEMTAACARAGPLAFHDRARGETMAGPAQFGDIVLARKDAPASYHVAVVVDDAAQGVTLVTRGADLFESTHIHRVLQALLGLPTPGYHHHRLMVDDAGKRLAKRHDALSLRTLRAQGHTADQVRAMARAAKMTA